MSDEYEYGPWLGWNGCENPPPPERHVEIILVGGLGALKREAMQSRFVDWRRGNVIAYRHATLKPKRELVVGKWYKPLTSRRWQRCIAIEGEMAWLAHDSKPPCAYPWEAEEIDWSTPPRDEAPE